VIIKTGEKCLKDLNALKEAFDDKNIKTTQATRKLIGVATGLDELKVKNLIEYWELSEVEANKNFAMESTVKVKCLFGSDRGTEKVELMRTEILCNENILFTKFRFAIFIFQFRGIILTLD